MLKKVLIGFVVGSAIIVASFKLIFKIPVQPNLVTSSPSISNDVYSCYQNPKPHAIDVSSGLKVTVWNIYKQNRENWRTTLNSLTNESQLVLLQEASMSEDMRKWIRSGLWGSNRVNAFEALNESAGVLNLATHLPIEACAYTHEEPWLQLPKSALWSRYQLSNGQQLAVVNIHAVNFTFGTEDYLQQLSALTSALREYRGPVIFAGDFNSWSEARFEVLQKALGEVGLAEVAFTPDNRTQFVTGLVLDHIFYRGLTVRNAKAPETDASDHNPMLVTFDLNDNREQDAELLLN
ncbi:endonuclease/exonuclease/phosphatase family protein [Vibrio sp. D404a]|uniref:endonuclease/exonuclease/phosphatase family protein n=1 Tax=unclassified Vibrio TaxID=2614977 RepID=UPI0025558A66|nr:MULTISPECIES: endonuclease/exonuclease/phosphatase family protein [unclassified Vibrio]MDK9738572.1 endonuclease/exonuclease/phosphatase family protein [Vibrio sp. D404a]MDK9795616.1 endonuclease/exonuclease/phosphatase family protein [Vibrio sp. D449a]